jgi:hypothetical protein
MVYLPRRHAALDTPGVAEGTRTVRTSLILPVEMHAALNDVAKREHRSLHAQMLHWLSEALRRDQAQQARKQQSDASK